MPPKTDRKAALTAYRERKPQIGIFRLTCSATGQAWVGASATLDKAENRHRFTLTQGTHPNKPLQAAWGEHGADAFAFATVERFPDDTPEPVRERLLKERLAHWAQTLPAQTL